MVRRKNNAHLSFLPWWSVDVPAVASRDGSLGSGYGSLSSPARRPRLEHDCLEEQCRGPDLEKDDDLAMEEPKGSLEGNANGHLEEWEVAERKADKEEFEAAQAIAAVREAENTEDKTIMGVLAIETTAMCSM